MKCFTVEVLHEHRPRSPAVKESQPELMNFPSSTHTHHHAVFSYQLHLTHTHTLWSWARWKQCVLETLWSCSSSWTWRCFTSDGLCWLMNLRPFTSTSRSSRPRFNPPWICRVFTFCFFLHQMFLFLFFIIFTSFLTLTCSCITSGKPRLRPPVGNSSSAVDPVWTETRSLSSET